MKRPLSVLCFFVWASSLFAQANLDSLRQVWANTEHPDSSRFQAFRSLIWDGYLYSQPDSAYLLAQEQFDAAKALDLLKWQADAINTQGVSHKVRGNFDEARKLFTLALEMRQEAGDQKAIAASMNNLGVIDDIMGQPEKAREWYRKSLQVSKSIGDKEEIANTLTNLAVSAMEQGQYEMAIQELEKSLAIWKEIDDAPGIASASISIATIHFQRGDYIRAIDWFDRCLKLYEEMDDQAGMATCLEYIGSIHKNQQDYATAKEYYQRALKLGRVMGSKGIIARMVSLTGTIERAMGNYEASLDSLQIALKLRKEMGSKGGTAATFNSIAATYREMEQPDSALVYYQRALALRREIRHTSGIAESLNGLSGTYQDIGEYGKSIVSGKEAYALASETGNAAQISNATKILYQSYKASGRYGPALRMLEEYHRMSDSIRSEESQRAVIRQEFKSDYEKALLADSLEYAQREAVKDLELEVKNQELAQTRILLISAGIGFLLILGLAYAVYRGKRRSDELLLNILPAETARELKSKGSAEARMIQQVTVLFTDFKGFTSLSEQLSPKDLVADLNECFSAFDRIVERHGVEKIKTIGDAYMAAGGLPTPNETHAKDVVMAALEIQKFMEDMIRQRKAENRPYFEIRIGVHTGPVVAGIVGVKKFQYDIWGDTVNTASRMESSGEVGKVNISEGTFFELQAEPELHFESRGKITAKGKGELEMYFVRRADYA